MEVAIAYTKEKELNNIKSKNEREKLLKRELYARSENYHGCVLQA
jgi:hypothetical protein